jgi:hypothetical protein
MNTKRLLTGWAVWIVASVSVNLSVSGPTLAASGRLLDQDGKPLAGAWVVARREECKGFAHCNTQCIEVKVAKTDAGGNFTFPSGPRSADVYLLDPYLEGYVPRYRQDGRRVAVSMLRGGVDDLFSHLDPVAARIARLTLTSSHMSCFTAPREERQALIPVYKAMFHEANSIARLPEHHKSARQICDDMYWTQLRPWDPGEMPNVERARKDRYLQGVEPNCIAPIDDRKEQEILAAIRSGDLAVIRRAAHEGFDFNRRLDGQTLPIIQAALNGSAPMVAALAAAGAKPDYAGAALDRVIPPPPHHTSNIAVVRALLDAGADPNRPDSSGRPPLIRAASWPSDIEVFWNSPAFPDTSCRCQYVTGGDEWHGGRTRQNSNEKRYV